MGLLSGILLAVGAVAAVVLSGGTALGLLAGGVLAVGAAAQMGIIGGSVGKFMKSGGGMALMAAVSLGAAVYGAGAGVAGESEAAASASSAEPLAGGAGQGVLQTGTTAGEATDMQAAALTNTSFMQTADTMSSTAQMQLADPALSQVSGVSQQSLNTISQQYAGTGSNAEASQAAMQQETATANAGNPLPGGSPAGPGMRAMAGQDNGATGTGATPGAPGALPPGTQGADAGQMLDDSTNAGYEGPSPTAGESSGFGGTLMKALNTKGGAAAITAGGSMLGGIGSGIAQKQAMEDQLKAAQWGNMQWQNKGQVDQLQAASAKPITVPQGYLQRAQQVRSLMSGSQGVQPLPAAAPGAPLAPSPVHV